jgi:predicted DNA-binding transcriptional regulator YafY
MPVNKAARFRFEVLDECLRNDKKKWTKAELLRHVNRRLELHYGSDASISASQLRYDLEAMQAEFGAPIEMYREGKAYLYRYEDNSFSLKNIPIEEEDLQKLGHAVELLRQIQGFTIADEMEEVVNRLESRYKFSGSGKPVIAFEDSPPMRGIENLEDIYHAILHHTPLKITYQTFREERPRIFHMHPYLLKAYAHRWYLLGYCEEKEKIINFSLDRMHEIRVARVPYIPNTFIDGNNYFRDMIGVTLYPDQEIERIELLFNSDLAPYVQTKPLHHSQEILQQYEDGSLRIQLQVYINYELIMLLLGYGCNVKVLTPTHLARQIAGTAHSVFVQYQNE